MSRLDSIARQRALESGVAPLDYLLSVMRNDGQPIATRLEAAKAAAPYVHAKLSAVAVSGEIRTHSARDLSDDQLAAIVAGAEARG